MQRIIIDSRANQETDTANYHRISLTSTSDILPARLKARELAIGLGFCGIAVTLIASAIGKLARSIVSHSRRGEIVLAELRQGEKSGIEITAHAEAPGRLENETAPPNAAGSATEIDAGVAHLRGMMDEINLVSSKPGHTTIIMRRWRSEGG